MANYYYKFLIAGFAAIASTAALASPLQSADSALTSLRGFKIGETCYKQGQAYEALSKSGFNVPSERFTCTHKAAEYHSDFIFRDEDEKQELIELSYTGAGILWNVKVSITWEGRFSLSERLTASQLDASIISRFGAPFVKTIDVVHVDKDHAAGNTTASYAWGALKRNDGPGQALSDSFGWTRWSKSLTGVVTQAFAQWSDTSPRVSLVVEMTDRAVIPAAIKAQEDHRAADAAKRARLDSNMLRGL